MALTLSGTVNLSPGTDQVVENLEIIGFINADSGGTYYQNLTIRNCWIKHPGGEAGIFAQFVNNLTIEDCKITNTSAASGQNENPEEVCNIKLQHITGTVEITRCTVRGAGGLYAVACSANFHVSFFEGHNMRNGGTEWRGQLAQFNLVTGTILLEDFSCINDPNNSQSADTINIFDSSSGATGSKVNIRRGYLDGNNHPVGCSMMIEDGSTGVLVEDVDAVRFGNGGFAIYDSSFNCTYRRCRLRDQIMGNQGLGPPSSDDGSGPTVFLTHPNCSGARFEQCKYWNVNDSKLFIWASSGAYTDFAAENFTPRSPIVNVFAWESPGGINTLFATSLVISTHPVLGPATLTDLPTKILTASPLVTAKPAIGDVRVLSAVTFFNASPVRGLGFLSNNVTVHLVAATTGSPAPTNLLGDAPVFSGVLGGPGNFPNGWYTTGNDDLCCYLVNPGTVNGTATYAAAIRETASGALQGLQHDFTWVSSQKYTIDCWVRIPTGIAPSTLWMYTGNDPILINANLDAQTRDVWYLNSIDYTALDLGGDAPFVAFINPDSGLSTGFDLALPTVREYGGIPASLSPFIGRPVYAKLTDKGFIALPRTTASPVIGATSTLKQNHVLVASPLAVTSSVSFDTPTVLLTDISFSISPFETASPDIAIPTLVLEHILVANNFIPLFASVVFGPAAIKQKQVLVASPLAVSDASIGTPVFVLKNLSPSPLVLSRPVFGSAVLKQKHVVVSLPMALTTSIGRPVVAAPFPLLIGDSVLDFGLNVFALANKIVVCSQRPTSYADVASKKIGEKSLGIGGVLASGPEDAMPNGRKITTASVTGGDVTTNGSPLCWAVLDDANSRLVASGPIANGVPVITSDHFSLQEFTITLFASGD